MFITRQQYANLQKASQELSKKQTLTGTNSKTAPILNDTIYFAAVDLLAAGQGNQNPEGSYVYTAVLYYKQFTQASNGSYNKDVDEEIYKASDSVTLVTSWDLSLLANSADPIQIVTVPCIKRGAHFECLMTQLEASDMRWNPTDHQLEAQRLGEWGVIENGVAAPLSDYLVVGPQGDPGSPPTIGENGNWYIDEVDTGKPSRGSPPTIGENGNWYIDEVDTGNPSRGTTGADGDDGVGVPEGGTEGQVLAKKTDTNYDTEWVDQTGGSGGSEPEDPAQYTTLGEVDEDALPIEGLETENEDPWTYGDEDESTNLLGLRMWIQTRQGYWEAGDKKWYAFFRLFTYSTNGALYSVSAETRIEINGAIPIIPDGTTEGQTLVWNAMSGKWEARAKCVLDFRLNKSTHKFQLIYSDAPSTWVDVSDDNGGILDPGVSA